MDALNNARNELQKAINELQNQEMSDKNKK
jgi:hypothetical protein